MLQHLDYFFTAGDVTSSLRELETGICGMALPGLIPIFYDNLSSHITRKVIFILDNTLADFSGGG